MTRKRTQFIPAPAGTVTQQGQPIHGYKKSRGRKTPVFDAADDVWAKARAQQREQDLAELRARGVIKERE